LGHVHSHGVLSRQAPAVVYPGCPQGLNPNETGPRGCCLVTVSDDGKPSVEFRDTDSVRWFIEEADISDMQREQDLLDALAGRLKGLASQLSAHQKGLVRFRLVGRGPLHRRCCDPQFAEHLKDDLNEQTSQLPVPVWTESVQSHTRPEVDLQQRREAQDFLGDFLRTADEAARDRHKLEELWDGIRQGIASGHAKLLRDMGIDPAAVPIEKLKQWLEEAAILGADHLLETER